MVSDLAYFLLGLNGIHLGPSETSQQVEKHSDDADSTRNIWTKELDEHFFLFFLNEIYTAGTMKVWLMQKPDKKKTDYDCVFCLTRALHMCGKGTVCTPE
jgi:hypothetical protein